MSDFKRWTDDESDATDAEREVLAAGKGLALGAERKAELRRALAIAISSPAPPDGGSGDGQGGGPPPPAAPPPPVVPPGLAETGGVLGGVGKLIFSGKASGALIAFAIAAGTTGVVLGVGTRLADAPPSGSVVAPAPLLVERVDDLPDAHPALAPPPNDTPAPSVMIGTPDAVAPSSARPARSFGSSPGEKPAEVDGPNPAVPVPVPPEAPAPAIPSAAAPPSAAVLVIPGAPDVRLADEIARVRAARDALRSGNAALTLSLLDALDREHPAGTLGQEREAMRIEALANSGRVSEARTRADAFLVRHRGSAFASSVSRFATP